jgi:acyl-CoA synthetase (AMP-forming)/AMP-acid ligase II
MFLTQPLHLLLQQQPASPFLIYRDRTWTVRDGIDQIARLAGGLQELGMQEGDRVALLGLNTDRFAFAALATVWGDGITVPVNTRWSVTEIAYSLNEAGVEMIMVDDPFVGMIPDLRKEVPGLATVIYLGSEETPDGAVPVSTLLAHDPVEDARRDLDAPIGIFYTGGTTGFPKGVVLPSRSMIVSAIGSTRSMRAPEGGTGLLVAPAFHLAGLAYFVSCLTTGTAVTMVPAFDPAQVLRLIQDNKISSLLLVPTMIQMVVDHPDLASYDLSGVEFLMYGASPMNDALMQRARKAFPNARFGQAYGMTELSPVATVLSHEDHDDPVRRRSAGKAAPHGLVKIVDPDDNEVPRGVVGEIVAYGEHVMLGYWNKPEETASALRGGWMHTGDGGYMDEDGYVFVVDRIKDMIISGGENVYSIEVENAVAKHPAVQQCAVIGIPDEKWGERVHAVVELVPGATLTLEELRGFCKEQIAGYKCPASLEIVGEWPLSGAGKILKRELRAERSSS